MNPQLRIFTNNHFAVCNSMSSICSRSKHAHGNVPESNAGQVFWELEKFAWREGKALQTPTQICGHWLGVWCSILHFQIFTISSFVVQWLTLSNHIRKIQTLWFAWAFLHHLPVSASGVEVWTVEVSFHSPKTFMSD